MPAFTQFLIIANVGIFLLQLAGGSGLVQWFGLWPGDGSGLASLPLFTPWQLVTYSFLHGNLMHLAFNMFALWMFGAELERAWGARRLATAYFASVVTGAVTHLLVAGAFGGGGGPVIGASAGVFGLLLAYALLFQIGRSCCCSRRSPCPRVCSCCYTYSWNCIWASPEPNRG